MSFLPDAPAQFSDRPVETGDVADVLELMNIHMRNIDMPQASRYNYVLMLHVDEYVKDNLFNEYPIDLERRSFGCERRPARLRSMSMGYV